MVESKPIENNKIYKNIGVQIASGHSIAQEVQNQSKRLEHLVAWDMLYRKQIQMSRKKSSIYKTYISPILTYNTETRADRC